MARFYVKHNSDGTLNIPEQIPPRRQNVYILLIPPVIIPCFTGAFLLTNSIQDLVLLALKMVLSLLMTEIFHRVILWKAEYEYLKNRYDDNIWNLLEIIFGNSKIMYVAACFAAVFTYVFWKEQSNESWAAVLFVMVLYTLSPLLQMKKSPIYKSIEISSPNNVDVGATMAISYFYGYLKILLPANATKTSGLKYSMDTYESRHQIKFARRALYILVPLSMSCPFRLNDISPIMDEAKTLNAREEDRAGVKNRNYKNSVYKIQFNGGYIYVAAEYASPLKTFDESVKSNDMFGSYYKLHKKDIVWQFYLTLLKLVEECSMTRGLVEFILYADYDKENRLVDVGKILLQRLNDDNAKYHEMP